MPKNNLHINNENIYEWLSSTGHLLPSTERELARFELLHPPGRINVNFDAIDPLAIINGSRQRKVLSWSQTAGDEQQQAEIRMAARRLGEVPAHIFDKIKKNQQKDDTTDSPEDPTGNK